MRFDDIVRTERYFTATLIPLILFEDWGNRTGLKKFINLVDAKVIDERNRDGESVEKSQPDYGTFDDAEVITEFHIERDLKYAGHALVTTKNSLGNNSDVDKKDAPDILIISGREIIVCEGKFFHDLSTDKLRSQLASRRRAVRHLLFSNDRNFRAYRHIAILPEAIQSDLIGADAVLTWADIADLAKVS